MRRRHPLLKAIAGVVALLVVGGAAGTAGVRVVQNMLNTSKSRLDRFIDGTDNPTIVTIGDPTARMTVALPSAPQYGHESMAYFGIVRTVDRQISPAGSNASVQIVWFRVVPALARNPEALLAALAGSQTVNLGGAKPINAHLVGTGTTAAYDFEVHPTGSSTAGSDYFVRIMLHGDVVYVVRVEASAGGADALKKVTRSIVWAHAASS